jgi:hypothetical protein
MVSSSTTLVFVITLLVSEDLCARSLAALVMALIVLEMVCVTPSPQPVLATLGGPISAVICHAAQEISAAVTGEVTATLLLLAGLYARTAVLDGWDPAVTYRA